MRPATNVYVLKCREFYKIGSSSGVHKRHYGISTTIPFEVELFYNFKPTFKKSDKYDRGDSVRKIEKYLHQAFIHKRVRGEWFLLNEEDLKKIPDLIQEAMKKKDNNKEIKIEVSI